VEPFLADELRRLNLKGVRPQRSGVLFSGIPTDAYRVLLWSRLASRVLMRLAEVDASSADTLYEGVKAIAWEDHLRASGTLAIDAVGMNDALRNTQFTAVKCKDAIADRFRERFGRRPSVDTRTPDVRVNVAIRAEKATISLDLSGVPMHRRGYRDPAAQVEAPMKESLAAAVLEVAGWREIAAGGGAFVDPMCGSGTIAIEAALMAADIAPGLIAREHAVTRWLGFEREAWERLVGKAQERRTAGEKDCPPILASDIDPRAVAAATACVRRAGVERLVSVSRGRAGMVRPPAQATHGLVATNPPYGERIGERAALPGLYAELATALRDRFDGWKLAVITPDELLGDGLGMTAEKNHELFNGRIASPVRVFTVAPAVAKAEPTGVSAKRVERQRERAREQAVTPPDVEPGTEIPVAPATGVEFANRLAKMAAHYGKWARRTGVTCYRVYDADLPDYNVAVDLYTGAGAHEGKRWVHVAEYVAPAGIDAARAEARLVDAVAHCAAQFEVGLDRVFLKRRERKRGSAQYNRVSKRAVIGTVAENGLLFEVNLSEYLDTGLFLDHRDTRAWLRELAGGTRFLNLFAYTGTASVYAAAGKAVSTTTVDLSSTYLDWARRNLALNGLDTEAHSRVRADVMEWLTEASAQEARYDLIFCDPPTFSNSKRMESTFDVQRDHVELIARSAALLADGGTLVFSCNRRRFEMDVAGLWGKGLVAADVTKRTIPKDFERRPGIHSCWTVRRA